MRKIKISLIIFFFAAILSGQNIIDVVPGDGTLSAAIIAASPGDILQLTGGAEYAHNSSDINKRITIQVKPGSIQKAIIKLSGTASASGSYYFFVAKNGASITLKGLEIHGLLGGVPVAKDMIRFDGRPDPNASKIGTFRFENCLFHDFTQRIVDGMIDANGRGLIQDSVFVNNVIVYNAEFFLQYKHVNLRHLEIKNSTMYKLQGEALKVGKIGYRCILVSSGKPYIAKYDSTITPTGFIDHCTLDDLGDIHGHMQVDDAFHLFTISNCIISNQDRMTGHPLLNPLTTLQPAIYFMDARPATAVSIQNTCFWKCAPPDLVFGRNTWPGYAFHDSVTKNPNYRDPGNGDFTLPANSPLLKYGSDGGAIGDPRWAQNTTQLKNEETIPEKFSLSQNYPNPFNPETVITYQLPVSGYVSLKIYDLLGREAATLVNGYEEAGIHNLKFSINNSSLSSGVYFYSLQTGNYASTKKMILTK